MGCKYNVYLRHHRKACASELFYIFCHAIKSDMKYLDVVIVPQYRDTCCFNCYKIHSENGSQSQKTNPGKCQHAHSSGREAVDQCCVSYLLICGAARRVYHQIQHDSTERCSTGILKAPTAADRPSLLSQSGQLCLHRAGNRRTPRVGCSVDKGWMREE